MVALNNVLDGRFLIIQCERLKNNFKANNKTYRINTHTLSAAKK